MIYLVDSKVVSKEEFDSALEDAVRDYVSDCYDDMLDDCYDEVKIGSCVFFASEILKKCDPIAYRCGEDDFVSATLEDSLYDFEKENEYKIGDVWFKSVEETYQVWCSEEDVDGTFVEDHGNCMEEFDNAEDAEDYLKNLTEDVVKTFIVDQGFVVAKDTNYSVVIETVYEDSDGSEVNVEDLDSRLFIFK